MVFSTYFPTCIVEHPLGNRLYSGGPFSYCIFGALCICCFFKYGNSAPGAVESVAPMVFTVENLKLFITFYKLVTYLLLTLAIWIIYIVSEKKEESIIIK